MTMETLNTSREAAHDALGEIMWALYNETKPGIEWWIEAGTFLGCIRNGGSFIGHDKDIDVGVLGDENAEDIVRAMESVGFTVGHRFGEHGKGLEISFESDKGIKVDVFFFYEDGTKLWHAAWRGGKMIRLEFERSVILPTVEDKMEGITVETPGQAEAYLVARYGEAWRTPDPSYRWDVGPRCINWEKSEITKDEILKLWP